MLSGSGRTFMFQGPWLALAPGLCLTVVVYATNMFGDALRDRSGPAHARIAVRDAFEGEDREEEQMTRRGNLNATLCAVAAGLALALAAGTAAKARLRSRSTAARSRSAPSS